MAREDEANTNELLAQIEAQNRRLTEEVQHRTELLGAINSVAAVVSQSLDLQETLDTALEAIMSVINVEASGISLIDEEASELVLRAQRGWRSDFVEIGLHMKLGEGLSGYVIDNNELVITGDVSKDDRIIIPAFTEEGVMAMALAPMHALGKVVGILSVMSYQPYQFSDDEISVLSAVADQVGVALENARLYGRVVSEQAHLKAIVNSSAEAIMAINSERQVGLASETLCRWFNLDASKAIGQQLDEVGLPDVLTTGIVKAMKRHRSEPTVFETPIADDRFLACHVSPLLDEHQQDSGWVIVLQDVTHFRELERLKSGMIRAAAHDLRNPLNVTDSALALLKSTLTEPTEQQQQMLTLAKRGIIRMGALIDDMLQLERIDAGVGIELSATNMKAVIKTVIKDSKLAAKERSHSLTARLPRTLPRVMGEESLLQRALDNVVSNAIKYTSDGGKIEIKATREGSNVSVEVTDTGRGIPAEAHARLFERFYRVTTGEEDEPGTGLGLAIVKSIIEQHGGNVWVRSKAGEGSTFGFSVPIAK